MRGFKSLLLVLCLVSSSAWAGQGRVMKVLPQFLDLKGRTALAPSLFDRDAYQSILRKHPKERSGIAFVIQWKAQDVDFRNLKLKVEMRGVHGNLIQNKTFERPAGKNGWFSNWTSAKLEGEEYKEFGELIAWRVTLWDGDKQLSEQKSFLW